MWLIMGPLSEKCEKAGAEVLVAGSAYFKAADRKEFVKTIQQ